MATRRIINSEKTILDIDADGNGIRVSPDEKSQTGPAVPAYALRLYISTSPFLAILNANIQPPTSHVIVKLLLFTLAMIAGPISVYYLLFKATSKCFSLLLSRRKAPWYGMTANDAN